MRMHTYACTHRAMCMCACRSTTPHAYVICICICVYVCVCVAVQVDTLVDSLPLCMLIMGQKNSDVVTMYS